MLGGDDQYYEYTWTKVELCSPPEVLMCASFHKRPFNGGVADRARAARVKEELMAGA